MTITNAAVQQQAVLGIEVPTQVNAAVGGVRHGLELLETDRLGLAPRLEAGQ